MKEEGWWLVLGDAETDKLLVLKRVSFGSTAHAKLQFSNGQKNGYAADGGRKLVLHLVSDSYLGLDQEFEIIS